MNQLRNSRATRRPRRANRPRALLRATLALGTLVGTATALNAARGEAHVARPAAPVVTTSAAGEVAASTRAATLETVLNDSLAGRSGKLRARFVAPTQGRLFGFLRQLLGDTAVAQPGVYAVAGMQRPFAFITMRAFEDKVSGRIGRYRIGFWPGERGRSRTRYDNPQGFIEVTPENQLTYVSEHFKLADFLTHDQQSVWPKYLVLREPLLDKLELVIDELRRQGYDVRRMHVMSGFRTPQYNANGGETAGRATMSRHQYGDAADVWVENGAGRMADLNRDGRVDTRDADIVARAAERVERSHPELVGGIGIYRATHSHGPFVHIDVRGSRARWGHS